MDKGNWFSTGDVASIDPLGYMRITDRSKDVIKSGGEWISSIEIENMAVSHEQVSCTANPERKDFGQDQVQDQDSGKDQVHNTNSRDASSGPALENEWHVCTQQPWLSLQLQCSIWAWRSLMLTSAYPFRYMQCSSSLRMQAAHHSTAWLTACFM